MKKLIVLIVFFMVSGLAWSQVDTVKMVKYSAGFRFKEGIYLSHQQLVINSPIPKKRILTPYNKKDFDFYDKLLSEKTVMYYNQYGLKKQLNVDDIWGFCRRGSVFINWDSEFYRIPVIGNICHFVATITVQDDRFMNQSFGYNSLSIPTPTTRTEVHQFLMEFETGKITDYSSDNVEILLMKTPELHEEFMELKRKKKKQMKFLYIRRLNEKLPLYIPVN